MRKFYMTTTDIQKLEAQNKELKEKIKDLEEWEERVVEQKYYDMTLKWKVRLPRYLAKEIYKD